MAARVGTGVTGTADAAASSIAAGAKSTATGNAIVVGVKWEISGVTLSSVTDTALNVYLIDQQLAHPTGGEPQGAIAYCMNAVGNAANVVTANFSNANAQFRRIAVEEWSGLTTSSPIDGTSTNNSGSSTSHSSGNITTTQPGLMFSWIGGFTGMSGFTAGGTPASTIGQTVGDCYVNYLISTTGQVISPASSVSSGNGKWVMLASAFKDASTTSAPPSQLPAIPFGMLLPGTAGSVMRAFFRPPIASSVSGVSGTLATTNADDTLAASGTTTVVGALARTNANDTSAAAGTTTILGTLARTNANDTSVASGTTTVLGTLARTNANDSSAASGTTTVLGTLATTNANDTLAASGSVGGSISGTLATTNANDTSAASGTTTVVGSLARANAGDASSAAGTTTVTGSLATTNTNDTLSSVVPSVTQVIDQPSGGYWPDYGDRKSRRGLQSEVEKVTTHLEQQNIHQAKERLAQKQEARRQEARANYVTLQIRQLLDEQDQLHTSIEALKLQLESAGLEDDEIALILALAS